MAEKLSVALGTFDGLHIGHQKVISTAVNNGLGLTPAVISFEQHPRQLLCNNPPELLTDLNTKKRLLKHLGIKKLILLDFEHIKDLSPTRFLDYIKQKHNIGMISCGFDFRFGKNAAGSVDQLYNFGKSNSIIIKVIPAVELDSCAVSSTRIRELIKSGQINKANAMLGRNFSFCSPVLKGDGRGKQLGFPTINQNLPEQMVQPKAGVYITTTTVDGISYESISNIGFRPTFMSENIICETHILNFEGNLYGKSAQIELIGFLRPEQKFQNRSDLTEQVQKDILAANNHFRDINRGLRRS